MKKILIILLAVFPLVFASCKKDDKQPGTLTGTLEGFMDKDTKVVYDPSSSDSPFSWQNGDKIRVFRKPNTTSSSTYGGEYTGSLTDDNTKAEFTYTGTGSYTVDVTDDEAFTGKYNAIYPDIREKAYTTASYGRNGFSSLNISLKSSYNTDVNGNLLGNPMFAESVSPESKRLPFKHICGLLRLQLQKNGARIISVKITTTTIVNGNYRLTSNSGIPSISSTSSGSASDSRKTITLNFPTPQDLSSQKSFFIPLPQGDYSGLSIEITEMYGQKCLKTQQSGTLHISRAMYSTISLGENDLAFSGDEVVGAKGGLFTISRYGDKVRFAQGNLQYQATSGLWHFADNQYDVCSDNANLHPSDSSDLWIDLFGWGTSGYSGSNPYNYRRADTYGPATGGFDVDGDQNYDWGQNAISNGGNEAGVWRTLTAAEWKYVISNRTNASNRVAVAIVNNQRGLIILPDVWPETGEPEHRGTNSTWDNPSTMNSYTLAQWAELEYNGAVFLPQNGYRTTTAAGVTSMNKRDLGDNPGLTYGVYWASTVSSNKPGIFAYNGYCSTVFNSTSNLTVYNYLGFNVRLVHDVE